MWSGAGNQLETFAKLCEAADVDPHLGTHAVELSSYSQHLEGGQAEAMTWLVLASLLALQAGSTRIPLHSDVLLPFSTVMGDAESTLAAAKAALSHAIDLVGQPGDFRPLIVEGDWLYHHRTHTYETRLVAHLRALLASPPQFQRADAASAVDRVHDTLSFALSDEQTAAVEHALTHRLAVITGGPGTGKTSIVIAILKALESLGVDLDDVAVAAPTGKATHRLKDSITAPSPTTLHRLLGYSPSAGRFRFRRDNPLPHRFIIVDEASMVDLVLMEALLQALAEGAHLVLLGDAEQLPSVETGTILRDLVPSTDAPHVVRLAHSHRMRADDPAGARVLTAAQHVRVGDFTAFSALRTQGIDLHQPGVTWFDAPDDRNALALGQFVDAWFDAHIREHAEDPPEFILEDGTFAHEALSTLDALQAALSRARILCVTRRFRTGADALNDALRRRFAAFRGSDGVLPGMPVMMLKNDYNRRLYNGDQGLLVRVSNDGTEGTMAAFRSDGVWRAHHLHALEGVLDLSFAMTVHKAQGSEFNDVALVLPEADVPILTRENLYTAITRARRSVFVYGAQEMLELGIRRKVLRYSGVAEKLHNVHEHDA